MEKESKEDMKITVPVMEQLQKERAKLRRKITRSRNLLLKHIELRSSIKILKHYKEEAETALKECIKINENLVDNYIEDPETREFEEEEQEIYQEDVLLAEEYFEKYMEKEWQAKPVAGEDETGKSRLRNILDQEEDLMQNVQSLAKKLTKMATVQNQKLLACRNDFGKPNWENVSVCFSHLSEMIIEVCNEECSY